MSGCALIFGWLKVRSSVWLRFVDYAIEGLVKIQHRLALAFTKSLDSVEWHRQWQRGTINETDLQLLTQTGQGAKLGATIYELPLVHPVP